MTQKTNPWTFDVRVRDRNLKAGSVTEKDVEKYLAALPDLGGQTASFATSQPALLQPIVEPAVEDFSDEEDEEDDDDDVEEVAAAPAAAAAPPPPPAFASNEPAAITSPDEPEPAADPEASASDDDADDASERAPE
ncbi:MAG: hypothetical protein JWP97_6342 [Labilithrix sp.]|nr:hypothetical protein [Labilithrix sp.]